MALYQGACHCGAAAVAFETAIPPEALPTRACQCGFCRAHGARTATDPAGRLRFSGNLRRYRFGLGVADFLICPDCGVYLGAIYAEDGRAWGTVNVNCLAARDRFRPAGELVSYEGEDAAARRARRRARWTPAEIGTG